MKNKINIQEEVIYLLASSLLVLIFMISIPMVIIKSSPTNNVQQISQEKNNDGKAEESKEEAKSTSIEVNGNSTVKVYITKEDKLIEVPLEEYITSVVSGEMPVSFETEALKAQAIAARTYLMAKKTKPCPNAKGGDVCDTTHCQVYISKETRLAKWEGLDAAGNWKKIEDAVKETAGKVLTYEDELVMYPQFFSTSSGNTENAIDVFANNVPYLVSKESKGEEVAPKFTTEVSIGLDEFINTINSKYSNAKLTTANINSNMEILSRSNSGGVKEIKLGGEKVKGTDFRFLIKLNSTNFEYNINGSQITFKCKGYGHGVGMSQWGANVMAKEGKEYSEILKHYYSGIEIKDLKFKE
ncbi:stage II sporulation protein D [Clostridium carnis]